jgi:hypothetical protein
MQTESFESSKNPIGASGYVAWSIEVLDTDPPLAAMMAGVQVAAHRGEQRAQMEVAGG